jgi:hypothetical protein
MLSRYVILTFGVLVLTSCQENFLVKPNIEKGEVMLTFAEDYAIYSKSFSPCLAGLQVYLTSSSTRPVKTWDIRSSQSQCVRLTELKMGAVPKGFLQHGPYLPVKRGGAYRVEARDHGHRNGAGEFTMPD